MGGSLKATSQSIYPTENRRLRVLLVSDFAYPPRAGTERLVFGIADWISSHYDIQADILTPNWDDLKEREKVGKVAIYRFKTHGKDRSRPLKRIKDYISAGMDLPKYDVYHGFFTLPPLLAAVSLSKLKGSRSVLSIFTRHQLEPHFKNPLERRFLLGYLKMADRITTTFWSFGNYFREHYFDSGKVITIPCWVEDYFKPRNVQKKGKEKIVLFAGRMVKEKGVFVLLEAFSRLWRKTNSRLVMVGPPVEEKRLKEAAARLGMAGQVDIIGFVPEKKLADWYRRADLVVAPSFDRDAFAWTLMEAMACGKPIVSTERLVAPMQLGDLGGIAEPNDVGSLENALLRLLENDSLRERCGSNARRASGALFDKKKIMAQYAGLYRKLANRG